MDREKEKSKEESEEGSESKYFLKIKYIFKL
jgi:hypothetical protein